MACPTGTPDWSGVTLETFNQTLLRNPALCTSCTCPLEIDGHILGDMSYYPSLAGNILFAALFGALLLLQVGFGMGSRTWGFLICMSAGLILEVLGYIARILMRDNMFTNTYFIMYLVCLTLGPAFFSAAIYLSLSRLVVIYAPGRARFRPQTYTYIFVGCDTIALLLQGVGGGLAAGADAGSTLSKDGINIMIAGVAWQVFSLALFGLLSFEFWLRARRPASSSTSSSSSHYNPAFAALRARRSFQPWFIVALALAGVFIFVRSVFRCAELSGGFSGKLANDEITFMLLEGTMIILACILLTAFHPGLVVGSEAWAAASWKAGAHGSPGDGEKAATVTAASSYRE